MAQNPSDENADLVNKIYRGRRFHQRESLPKHGGGGGGMAPAPEPVDDDDDRVYAASGSNWVELFKPYIHVQNTPSLRWQVQHGLGKLQPNIFILDDIGLPVEGTVDWPTATRNYVEIAFGLPTKGQAVLS
jgi:hypothetical protein